MLALGMARLHVATGLLYSMLGPVLIFNLV